MAVTKTIEVSGIPCTFKSSAAIPRMYRLKFQRDIFLDLNRLNDGMKQKEKLDEEGAESNFSPELLELFENVAYIMHIHGDPSQPKDIDEWLEQFDVFDIYLVLPELLELWNLGMKQMSVAKKKIGK